MSLHIKKIKPKYTSIITTGERYKEDMYENGLIVAKKGDLKVYQKVLATGSSVRDVQVGELVMINVANYAVRRYSKDSIQNDMDNNPVLQYRFNWVQIDDEHGVPQDCLLLDDRDVLFSFEGEEVQGEKSPILMPSNKEMVIGSVDKPQL